MTSLLGGHYMNMLKRLFLYILSTELLKSVNCEEAPPNMITHIDQVSFKPNSLLPLFSKYELLTKPVQLKY